MKIIAAAILLTVIVVGYLSASPSVDIIHAEENHYCEMVTIWNETNGNYGHPDYKKTFLASCVDK